MPLKGCHHIIRPSFVTWCIIRFSLSLVWHNHVIRPGALDLGTLLQTCYLTCACGSSFKIFMPTLPLRALCNGLVVLLRSTISARSTQFHTRQIPWCDFRWRLCGVASCSEQWAPSAHLEAHNPSIYTGSCQTWPPGQLRRRKDWSTVECFRQGSESTQAGPPRSRQCSPVAVWLPSVCSPYMSLVQTSRHLDPNQTSAFAGDFPKGQCCQAATWSDGTTVFHQEIRLAAYEKQNFQ